MIFSGRGYWPSWKVFLYFFSSIKSYLIQRKYSYKNGGKGVKTGNKDDKWLAARSEKEMGRQKVEGLRRRADVCQALIKVVLSLYVHRISTAELSAWICLYVVYETLC
jgi:hypothetical protein